MPRNLIACFRSPITSDAIDADAGIIRGVKVLQKGRRAVFAGKDGKPKSVMIDDRHIDALLKYAGNRGIPSHWTHDYHGKGDTVELNSRIGALASLRKDDDGSLVADYALKKGEHRDDVLFFAEHNPEGAMLSAVFAYDEKDPDCIPLSFDAADLVPRGAGVTALFSETKPQSMLTDEDKTEISQMISSAIQGHSATAISDTDAAALMSAAGVTETDQLAEDKDKPVLVRAQLAITRAHSRQAKTATAQLSEAQKGEIATLAKAAVVGEIGKGGFLSSITGGNEGGEKSKAFVARLSKYLEAGESQGRAIALAKQRADSGEVSEWETAGRPMPSKAA